METISNETAAKLITLQDAVWQLGNTLRDCMNRMDTIHGEHPSYGLDHEIRQSKHTLERYARGPLFYKPHPFGWKYDSATHKDQLAVFPPNDGEIKV